LLRRVVRLVRLHFTNATDRDHHVAISRGSERGKEVDVGYLLEQLRLRIRAQRTKAGGGNLKVAMPIGPTHLMPALDEERRGLQFRSVLELLPQGGWQVRRVFQSGPGNANGQVGTQVRD